MRKRGEDLSIPEIWGGKNIFGQDIDIDPWPKLELGTNWTISQAIMQKVHEEIKFVVYLGNSMELS